MDQKPLFIAGAERSGKSILSACLASHSHIAIPSMGTYMWPYYYKQFGDLEKTANFERCLKSMLTYKHIAQLDPDPDRLRQDFKQGSPTYPRLFALFLMHYTERQGKLRWGDQAVLLERYADAIFEGYPLAKIIHMIRDPRDRYHAARSRTNSSLPQMGEATARWLYSARAALCNSQRFPDQYKVMRYEDLVTSPEETLRRICTFLDEEYEPSMLTLEAVPAYREKLKAGSTASTLSPLDPSYIGRYRDHLSLLEIQFIQKTAGHEMESHGYPLQMDQENQKARFLITEKIGTTLYQRGRMAGWLIQEKLRTRWPATFGRSPEKRAQLPQARDKPYRTEAT